MNIETQEKELDCHFFHVKGVTGKKVDQDERDSSNQLGVVQKLSFKLEKGRKVEKKVANLRQNFGFGVGVGGENRR